MSIRDVDQVVREVLMIQMTQTTGNYTKLLGYGDNHSLTEYLRLYIALHGDHEGGNASAHTARKHRLISPRIFS